MRVRSNLGKHIETRYAEPEANVLSQATLQGVEAVEALLAATPETPSYMIGISENKITRVPLLEAVAETQAVATAIENKDFDKAMSYRDPEFAESLQAFIASSTLDDRNKLPRDKVSCLCG